MGRRLYALVLAEKQSRRLQSCIRHLPCRYTRPCPLAAVSQAPSTVANATVDTGLDIALEHGNTKWLCISGNCRIQPSTIDANIDRAQRG